MSQQGNGKTPAMDALRNTLAMGAHTAYITVHFGDGIEPFVQETQYRLDDPSAPRHEVVGFLVGKFISTGMIVREKKDADGVGTGEFEALNPLAAKRFEVVFKSLVKPGLIL
jgi:hypothetical protein